MDVLGRLLTGSLRAATPGPTDDFWFGPVGTTTPAGVRVSPEIANKVSAWFRGREIIATGIAMLPLDMFENLPNDQGPQKASGHPLHDLIHHQPNDWLNAFDWRRMLGYHLIDHGNHYAFIEAGDRGFASQLQPIQDPTTVTPKLVNRRRKVYEIKDPKTGGSTTALQDEIFHLHILSTDGVQGRGVLSYARDCLGLTSVLEQFASRIFSRGTLSAGALEVPGVLTDDASRRMAQSFSTSHGDWHLPKVLEQGAKWVQSEGLTPENAQMLLSRKFGIDEVARFLGVPRHMLENSDPSFGNAEQFNRNFIDFTMGWWLVLIEMSINTQLVSAPQKYYAEFNRNAIARGDLSTRWAAYVDAITTGTYTRNEVRRMENRPSLPGLDEPLTPAHLTGKQPAARSAAPKAPAPAPPAAVVLPDPEPVSPQAHAIAVAAACRVLRKEVAAVQQLAKRHASDADAYAAAVTEFYAGHAALVAQTLLMPPGTAAVYCAEQAGQLLGEKGGLAALDAWGQPAYATWLAEWALGEGVAA